MPTITAADGGGRTGWEIYHHIFRAFALGFYIVELDKIVDCMELSVVLELVEM